ncbi:HlyD family efflux transporter periplasmic adaptor subunit [uncultured Hyphomonas sp.]|uniref:HlyD family secretion protein n=1 Tax=uncultured Hyphomonas sp. TaxID=225298 RepID=UPI002AAA99A6|nr:HlyD family efflux transporter periplasmic adaptor subunit [uncultured Hyphomonas sp.]
MSAERRPGDTQTNQPSETEAVSDFVSLGDAMEAAGRDKRKYPRYSAPLTIEINGHAYPALDWSLSGFRIGEVRELALAGEKVRTTVSVQISDFEFRFETLSELLRIYPEKREAAFTFTGLSPEEVRALGFISSAHISGKLKSVDGILRNVSTGTSSASSEEEIDHALQIGRRKVFVRRGVFALLAVLALLSARASILAMTSISSVAAWVDTQLIEISAPEPSVVRNILAGEGTMVKPGDAIATLSNGPLEAELADAEAEKRVMEVRLEGLQAILAGRSGMLQTESAQAVRALQQAQARRDELRDSLAAAKAEVEKLRSVSTPGLVPLSVRTNAEQAVAEITERIAQAERDVEDARSRLSGARSGFFVGNARATGYEPATLQVAIPEVEQEIAAAEVRIDGLRSRLNELSVVSPCNCRVSEVIRLPGERVTAQEPLMRLEAMGETRMVSAFVKHSDARRLKVGQRVSVRLADGRRDRNATITDISATIQLSSENKLFNRDLNPERYAQLGIRLSEEFADAPGAAVETTIHRPLLRWLADIFRF